MRPVLCVLAACLLLAAAGCGGSTEQSTPEDPRCLRVRRRATAAVRRSGPREQGATRLLSDDVSYTAGHDRIDGYLVLPPKSGTRRAGGDLPARLRRRSQAARRSCDLARRAARDRPRDHRALGHGARRRRAARQTPGSVSRLGSRSATWSPSGEGSTCFAGGQTSTRAGSASSAGAPARAPGAILAGVEPRLRAVVLMSGGATPISSYAARAPASLRPTVRRYLGIVDPLRYVGRATPSGLLLQDGRRDQVVPRSALVAMARAAPGGHDRCAGTTRITD